MMGKKEEREVGGGVEYVMSLRERKNIENQWEESCRKRISVQEHTG